MPYLYCDIDYGSNCISQNIFLSKKHYKTIVRLVKDYDENEYDYEVCPLFAAIADKYPHIYDELYNLAAQYVALSLADGTYNKTWKYYYDIEITSISFESYGEDIKIRDKSIQLFKKYLKVIQWKCPDAIIEQFLSYIDINDIENRKDLNDIVEEHNKRYKLTYKEWETKKLYLIYAFEQYKREFEELLKNAPEAEKILQIGKELQEDWKVRHQTENEILTKRNLEDLILLLNRYLKDKFPSSPLIQYDITMQQIFHNDKLIPTRYDGSVRAYSIPIGGQGGYKRRIKRK